MAKVDKAFSTYLAKGVREDLSNVIYNIDPSDTPIISAIGTRDVSQPTFDWQTEALPAVNLANNNVEGFTLTRQAAQPTVRLSNVCQISERDATVTGTMEASDHAGYKGAMAHQMALKGKALKRDMESILSQNQARNNGSDDGAGTETPRKTRAMESWIVTNASRGAGGSGSANETTPPVDSGSPRDLAEDLLKSTLQLCYTNGAEPTMVVFGPINKMNSSSFMGRLTARQSVGADVVQQKVTLYASDFGTLKFMPSRWVRERSALLLDPEYWAVAYLRRFQTKEIAKIGDADTKMIISEWGLESRNEKANGIIADLNVALLPAKGYPVDDIGTP